MKVAVVADSHFDQHKRFEECIRLHDWIAEDCRRRGIDLFIHTGDVYERKSTPLERLAASAWFQKMAALAPGVVVRGNHDALDDLPLLAKLETDYTITVVETAAVIEVGDALIACVAWPRKAALLAATGSDSHEGSEALATEALRNMLRGLGDQLAEHDGPTMLAMHAMVRDSVTSTGQPLVGCDFEIGLEDLALVRAAAYFLGHIHMRQHWLIGAAFCGFPGSPRRTNYGETEPKGYLVATFEGKACTGVEFVEVPATPMFLVEDEWGVDGWLCGMHGMPESVAGAEMRLRYRVRSDMRHAARSAAADLEAEWRAAGAVDVKLDPQVILERRTRADAIPVKAPLSDKTLAFWQAKGFDPAERRAALLAKLLRIDPGGNDAHAGAMAVTLEGFRIRGFGPFEREFSADLTTLSPSDRIVAICGENGAGKTTALELALPGAMFRDTPTRGSLVDLATAADAFLETRIVAGQPYTLRHMVDNRSGKSEALVIGADGEPVLPDTKVRSFDAWASKHMPAPEVFFAGAFAPQGAGGFLGAKPSARKDVLLQLIGPEMRQIEQAAVAARDELKAAKAALVTLEARIADERARGGDVGALENAIVVCRGDVDRAAEVLATTRQEFADAEQQNRDHDAIVQANQRGAEDLAKLVASIAQARLELADFEARARNNRDVLDRAAEIRAAEARLPVLRQQIADKAAQLATARAEADHWNRTGLAEVTRGAQAAQRIVQAESRLAHAADVARAIEQVPGLQAELTRVDAEVAYEEEALDRLRGQRVAGADGRIEELRGTLIGIRALRGAETEQAPEWADHRVDADDEHVRLAAELPNEIKVQEGVRREKLQVRAATETALRAAEAMAARAGEVERARQDKADAKHEADAADLARQAAENSGFAARQKRDGLDKSLQQLQAELATVEPAAGKAAHLAKAEGVLAERERQIENAQIELRQLDAQMIALPAPADLPAVRDLPVLRGHVLNAEDALSNARSALTKREQLLDQARASLARLAELDGERTAAEAEGADWTRLANDLGKDGLQAMIIDGSIPEINELANDLLHAAFGPRFTIEVRTQASDAKGKRLLETLDVWVIDTGTAGRKGREGPAETFSGGEKTILAEALSLALTALACRRAGAVRPTLIRDESAGALSEGNAPIWVSMLRRAADLIDADRVLFVNHDRQTWDLADARIDVTLEVAASKVLGLLGEHEAAA